MAKLVGKKDIKMKENVKNFIKSNLNVAKEAYKKVKEDFVEKEANQIIRDVNSLTPEQYEAFEKLLMSNDNPGSANQNLDTTSPKSDELNVDRLFKPSKPLDDMLNYFNYLTKKNKRQIHFLKDQTLHVKFLKNGKILFVVKDTKNLKLTPKRPLPIRIENLSNELFIPYNIKEQLYNYWSSISRSDNKLVDLGIKCDMYLHLENARTWSNGLTIIKSIGSIQNSLETIRNFTPKYEEIIINLYDDLDYPNYRSLIDLLKAPESKFIFDSRLSEIGWGKLHPELKNPNRKENTTSTYDSESETQTFDIKTPQRQKTNKFSLKEHQADTLSDVYIISNVIQLSDKNYKICFIGYAFKEEVQAYISKEKPTSILEKNEEGKAIYDKDGNAKIINKGWFVPFNKLDK